MRKRNVHIQFWLDKKEAETLRKRVKRSGLSSAAYVRHLINGVVPQDAPPPDYYAMMQQLYRIGNNLNQIAKRMNATGNVYKADVNEVKELMKQVWQSQKSMLSRQPSIRQ